MSNPAIIEIRNLTKTFKGAIEPAVDGISFLINRNEIFGLILGHHTALLEIRRRPVGEEIGSVKKQMTHNHQQPYVWILDDGFPVNFMRNRGVFSGTFYFVYFFLGNAFVL